MDLCFGSIAIVFLYVRILCNWKTKLHNNDDQTDGHRDEGSTGRKAGNEEISGCCFTIVRSQQTIKERIMNTET